MSLTVSLRQFRSTLFTSAIATVLLGTLSYKRWRGLSRFGRFFVGNNLVQCILIFVIAAAALLQPALAAERKTRAPDQQKRIRKLSKKRRSCRHRNEHFATYQQRAKARDFRLSGKFLAHLATRQSENVCCPIFEHESDAFLAAGRSYG
jgi:hypothetical protein